MKNYPENHWEISPPPVQERKNFASKFMKVELWKDEKKWRTLWRCDNFWGRCRKVGTPLSDGLKRAHESWSSSIGPPGVGVGRIIYKNDAFVEKASESWELGVHLSEFSRNKSVFATSSQLNRSSFWSAKRRRRRRKWVYLLKSHRQCYPPILLI